MLLNHVTLGTGHSVLHRIDTLRPEAVQACRKLLPSGGTVPAFAAYRVEITSPVFSIWREADPIVICAVGNGFDPVWHTLCTIQQGLMPLKVNPLPPGGTWLAVALLYGLCNMAQADLEWLGDFERCMAAAILNPNG